LEHNPSGEKTVVAYTNRVLEEIRLPLDAGRRIWPFPPNIDFYSINECAQRYLLRLAETMGFGMPDHFMTRLPQSNEVMRDDQRVCFATQYNEMNPLRVTLQFTTLVWFVADVSP
jgi:hypothetical protein